MSYIQIDERERNIDFDVIERRFIKRYKIKKIVNMIVSFMIVFCGVSAVLYSLFVFHKNIFDRMRYMTFDGTMFTTLISLFSGLVFIYEIRKDTEITNRTIYFLRLSCAVMEFVIFIVVMFGLTSLVPDDPDIETYTGIMMHLVIPFLMLLSFVLNDPPIGKLKPIEPLYGTIYITIYALVMLVLFGFRILPSSLAPYSFLDFDNTGWGYKLLCICGVYTAGYFISELLSFLNSRLSWIWFYDLNRSRLKKRGQKGGK